LHRAAGCVGRLRGLGERQRKALLADFDSE